LANPGGSFQDVDGLASLLLAGRLAAAKVLAEEVQRVGVTLERWNCVEGNQEKHL
jgi:hypothetical protein